MRMATEILSALFTLVIGIAMEVNSEYFLYFYTLNPVIVFVLHIFRDLRERRERSKISEENEVKKV